MLAKMLEDAYQNYTDSVTTTQTDSWLKEVKVTISLPKGRTGITKTLLVFGVSCGTCVPRRWFSNMANYYSGSWVSFTPISTNRPIRSCFHLLTDAVIVMKRRRCIILA